MNRLAIITGFLGGVRNRYMTYQDERTLAEKLRMAAAAEGISGVEACYPQDFADPAELKRLLDHHGLGVSAVNFRSRRTCRWMRGSFSSRDPEERAEAVDDLKRAMDQAAGLGCMRVTTCPLNDGHDVPFEMDYARAYNDFAEAVARAAAYNPDVRIAIEYKQNDPRARSLLGNAGETLALCQEVGLANVGVTLDTGHSLQAGERPAQAAVLLARAGRLFHVHLNDNDRFWDWDMIPGTYNIWDLVEFFHYLRRLGYDDWFSFDIYPKEIDTVRTYAAAAGATRKLMELAGRLDPEKVEEMLERRDPAESVKMLFELL